MKTNENYTLLIDTEQYAGNFERAMAAWITGQLGDCRVGQEEAEIALQELPSYARKWFNLYTRTEADEQGCYRPTSIYPTPGWQCAGELYFKDGSPLPILFEAHRKAQRKYWEPHINHAKAEIAKGNKFWGVDLKRAEKALTFDLARTNFLGSPAYLSVGIFFNQPPPTEILDVIKQRAKSFNTCPSRIAAWDETITITGFRLATTIIATTRKTERPV